MKRSKANGMDRCIQGRKTDCDMYIEDFEWEWFVLDECAFSFSIESHTSNKESQFRSIYSITSNRNEENVFEELHNNSKHKEETSCRVQNKRHWSLSKVFEEKKDGGEQNRPKEAKNTWNSYEWVIQSLLILSIFFTLSHSSCFLASLIILHIHGIFFLLTFISCFV